MSKAAASGKEVTRVEDSPPQPLAPRKRSEALREAYLTALANPAFSEERLKLIDAAVERSIEDERKLAFAEAMANCQNAMKPIAADANNPQTHSKYATYAKLVNVLQPIYTKNGFSVEYNTEKSELGENYVKVVGEISHADGFSKIRSFDSPIVTTGLAGKVNMTITHARMSAVTYGKRCVLAMMFNIAVGEVDDDGNAAAGKVAADDKSNQPIGDAQVKVINSLIKEAGLDKAKYLEWLNVETVEDILTGQYTKVVMQLTQRKKMVQEAKEAKEPETVA